MSRELTDLPFANRLESAKHLQVDGEYDCAFFDEISPSGPDARNAMFTECAFRSVSVENGQMQSSRFHDVWLHGVRFTGSDLTDSIWRDAEVVDGAWSGVMASGMELRRVVFHGCKLDSVNFRGAVLMKVEFVDCVLRHLDISGAKFDEVSFPGSRIEGLTVRQTQLRKVDFRGAQGIGTIEGVEWLKGAIIAAGQLTDLAPAFAAEIGIVVDNE